MNLDRPIFRRVYTRGNSRAGDKAAIAERLDLLTNRKIWGSLAACLFATSLFIAALAIAIAEVTELQPTAPSSQEAR